MVLISGLPEEIGLECLTRLPYTTHRVAARVCRRWRELLQSPDFYYHRKQAGFTHKVACLIQALPVQAASDGRKFLELPSYGVVVFNPENRMFKRVDPVPKYPNGLPLFCQVTSVEGKLVVMGGWDSVSWNPVKDVFIYDFVTNRWRQGKDMPSRRSFFAVGVVEGCVLIAGGHDENKNALKSAWVYDLKRDEWNELGDMNEERDECEGVVIGNEFRVVSGYDTESQGRFKSSAESYELRTGEWKRVEGAWIEGRCPRACVGVGKSGNLFCWTDSDVAVRAGACVVEMGERAVVSGVAFQDGAQGLFLVGMKEGQNGKFEKIDVATEYSGFVQSGCCVEI